LTTNNSKTEVLQRQLNEMRNMAQAHALAATPLPAEFLDEYLKLEEAIKLAGVFGQLSSDKPDDKSGS
jgi:hypothetical protein